MKQKFFGFMASAAGRAARVITGIALLLVGLLVVKGAGGVVLAVIALVPLLAGLFDVCVFSRLFGGPFKGADIRSAD
ncbi:MAG: DUF2892 domain-containing protein [Acidimicrobiia bacterium]|nr:DUF2892 domain-containing protein [Acidimicrobiia bacterium]